MSKFANKNKEAQIQCSTFSACAREKLRATWEHVLRLPNVQIKEEQSMEIVQLALESAVCFRKFHIDTHATFIINDKP